MLFELHERLSLRILPGPGIEFCDHPGITIVNVTCRSTTPITLRPQTGTPQTNGSCECFDETMQRKFNHVAFRRTFYVCHDMNAQCARQQARNAPVQFETRETGYVRIRPFLQCRELVDRYSNSLIGSRTNECSAGFAHNTQRQPSH